ncbi:unnamed protein product [Phaeothamnion confervicola]
MEVDSSPLITRRRKRSAQDDADYHKTKRYISEALWRLQLSPNTPATGSDAADTDATEMWASDDEGGGNGGSTGGASEGHEERKESEQRPQEPLALSLSSAEAEEESASPAPCLTIRPAPLSKVDARIEDLIRSSRLSALRLRTGTQPIERPPSKLALVPYFSASGRNGEGIYDGEGGGGGSGSSSSSDSDRAAQPGWRRRVSSMTTQGTSSAASSSGGCASKREDADEAMMIIDSDSGDSGMAATAVSPMAAAEQGLRPNWGPAPLYLQPRPPPPQEPQQLQQQQQRPQQQQQSPFWGTALLAAPAAGGGEGVAHASWLVGGGGGGGGDVPPNSMAVAPAAVSGTSVPFPVAAAAKSFPPPVGEVRGLIMGEMGGAQAAFAGRGGSGATVLPSNSYWAPANRP